MTFSLTSPMTSPLLKVWENINPIDNPTLLPIHFVSSFLNNTFMHLDYNLCRTLIRTWERCWASVTIARVLSLGGDYIVSFNYILSLPSLCPYLPSIVSAHLWNIHTTSIHPYYIHATSMLQPCYIHATSTHKMNSCPRRESMKSLYASSRLLV